MCENPNHARATLYPRGTCRDCGKPATYACQTWQHAGRSGGKISRRVSYRCGDCAERWLARQEKLGKVVGWYYNPSSEA